MSVSCDGHCAVYRETWRKARKEHQCHACPVTIGKGDLYTYLTIVDEGTVTVVKRCAACQTLHLHLRELCRKRGDDDQWPDEWLGCGLKYEDEWGNLPEEITRLAFMTPAEVQSAKPWAALPKVEPKPKPAPYPTMFSTFDIMGLQ